MYVMEATTPLKALKRAIEVAGSQSELGRRLGVRQQSVYEWLRAGRVPAARVLDVERAVDGKVTRYELRPDIYPPAEADVFQDAGQAGAEEVTEATG
jgi:DNA-binding transcriptional regulator YdaS (Cro superfamily)